jgi:hypothetical protein
MSEPESLQPRYGRRFVVNAILLAVVWTLAWMWFNAHVKPHISVLLFSGVSCATLGAFGYAAFRSFFEGGEAKNFVRERLRSNTTTPFLLALLPLLAFAFMTTYTIYLNAGDKFDDVRLGITCNSSTASTSVTLSPSEKQKAVSYFFALRPVTVHVNTRVPSGYRTVDVPLRRGMPVQLTVPDAGAAKPFYVVRLVPLYDLFHLRGRTEPDAHYVVRVFLPGRQKPIERTGLSFRAIYLGASADDLRRRSKTDHASVAELRNMLHAIDSDLSPVDIDGIVADWLDNPDFIATPELKPGDNVRVELQGPAGRSETNVKVSAQLNDAFLKGLEQ